MKICSSLLFVQNRPVFPYYSSEVQNFQYLQQENTRNRGIMNVILSARNDTDKSDRLREIKKQEDYHGSKNSSITKRCKTLHNRQIKRGISDSGFIPGR
jgi:hypothetical protein